MKFDESKIGKLMVAVSMLEEAKVLFSEQAEAAYTHIRALSQNVARKLRSTVNDADARRRPRSRFEKDLPENSPLRKILPLDGLKRLSDKHGRLLTFLLENQNRIVPYKELITIGWPEGNGTQASLTTRMMEIRDRVEPYIDIQTIESRGYQLFTKEESTPGSE